MENASVANSGFAVSTTDDYATTISASTTLVTVYDAFNSIVTLMPNDTTSATEPLHGTTIPHYVVLDIHRAIRLYYQAFITLFGIVANVISLVVTLSKRMRKHSTCLYMSAISGSDAVTLVIAFVWWLGRYVDTTSVWSCKLILFVFYYAIHFSVTLLVAMTVERFVAIRFPFWTHVHLTRRKSVYVIIGVAASIFAIDIHNVFTRTMVVDAATKRKMCLFSGLATLDMSYGFFHIYIWPWIDASVYSFFPLTMLAIFNPLIIHSVRQRATEQKYLSDSGNKLDAGAGHSGSEQQITMMLLSVTFTFIILTGPIAVTLILEKSWNPPKEAHGSAIWRLWRTVVSNMMYTNHAINFLLYSMSGRKFRRELRRLMPGFVCGGVDVESTDTSRNATPSPANELTSNVTSVDTPV